MKADNILLEEPDGALRLADFGVAMILGQADDEVGVMGTPLSMAPEQWLGRVRSLGAWTDVYAVGCLAWFLATGAPVFSAPDLPGLRRAHLSQPLGDLEPPEDWPDWSAAWLRTLLAKAPEDRFQTAADAACMLRGTEGPGTAPFPGAGSGMRTGSSETQPIEISGAPPLPPPGGRQAWPEPGMPPRWTPERPHPILQLSGAGVGLLGVRAIPLVARRRERDVLWEALREVRATRRTAAIQLTGEPGIGRTRLAAWLCHRVHETGAATAIRLDTSAGLEAAMAQWIRCEGLSGAPLRAFLVRRLLALRIEDLDADQLTDWLGGVPLPASERFGLFARMLERLGVTRPVVLVLTGDDAAGIAGELLRREALATLILLVGGDRCPGATPLELTRLARADVAELVRAVVGLGSALADEVVDRADGVPLFATQLVADWSSRGLLVPARDGLQLAPDADVSIPDDLHAIWSQRLAALARERVAPLQVAALLGREGTLERWAAACREAGIPLGPHTDDALARSGLLAVAEGRWRLGHALLRESLVRSVRDGGRWKSLHAACAAAIPAETDDPRASLARARHLFEAGEPAAAQAACSMAFAGFESVGNVSGVAQVIAVSLAAAEPESPEAHRAGLWQGRLHLIQGELDRACELFEELVARPLQDHLPVTARIGLGTALLAQGRGFAAARVLREADSLLAASHGNWRHEAALRYQLAQVLWAIRDRTGARTQLEALATLAEQHPGPRFVGYLHAAKATMALSEELWDEARTSALIAAEHLPLSRAILCLGIAAEARLRAGDGEGAFCELEALEVRAKQAGLPAGVAGQLSTAVGLTAAHCGRYAEAHPRLRQALERAALTRTHRQAAVAAGLAVSAGMLGNHDEARAALDGAERILRTGGGSGSTTSLMVEHAARVLLQQPDRALGIRALDLARRILPTEGWEERLEALEALALR